MSANCCSPTNAGQPSTDDAPARGSRRRLLASAAGLGALGALGAAAPASAASHRRGPRTVRVPDRGTAIVTLGTQGGPPVQPRRAGISSALVVDGATYMVDAGRRSVSQYVAAGLAWADLRSVFVTHLHADHVAELFQIFLLGGFQSPVQGDTLAGPTPVHGPGPAGGLPPAWGGGTPSTTSPEEPTPGTEAFFDHAGAAYAYSTNVFMRDSGIRETRGLADVREIAVPEVGASFENTAPAMAPFVVTEDDRVRVSAVLVPHGPVFPAFAYRFDTDHGSVTFSGDTTYSDNLLTLARGSDVLVHEAINVQGWAGPDVVKAHLLEGHVEVQKVGGVAQRADVDRLLLSHIGDMASPELDPQRWRRWAQRGYDGRVRVAEDLGVVRVG